MEARSDVTTTALTAAATITGLDESEVVSRIKDGDREAFAFVVERYGRELVAYLGRLTGDHARAEDIAQETFARFYRARDRFEDRGRLAPYLYRIATNLVRSQERRRRRWRALEPVFRAGARDTEAPVAQRKVLEDELHVRLREALAELPIHYRVPLILFEVHDWSHAAIGEALGCAEGTVKSRLHRARKRLRERLEPHLEERSPQGGSP